MLRSFSVVGALLLIILLPPRAFVTSAASSTKRDAVSTPTDIRLMDPGWWPTKGTSARDQYVGSETCARCHLDIVETQKNTPMANAVTRATADAFTNIPPAMHFRSRSYEYLLSRTATGAEYSVSDGQQSASAPLNWVFGDRQFGDTFLYQQNGSYFESRVSYYRLLDGLDFTTGHPRFPRDRIETVLGRRMSPDEPPLCFGCHSTASSTDGQFHPERLIAGISCEACHGPGAQHVAQMSLGPDANTSTLILNPARLRPNDSVDFCGACHRTSADVSLSSITGIFVLRFPAYRLEQSRCWGNGDARLTCVACHDPHKPRVTEAGFYDKVCVSCHSPASSARKDQAHAIGTCRVSNHDCVSCHMPKYTIPSMHTKFTDHKIAVHGEQFSE
jgi:Cytochrome c554 and c-prime